MEKQAPRRTGTGGNAHTAVTSYDVAQLAGVSQSAVSRCFRPGSSIAPKTRLRVLEAARQLGYAPNAMASGLITKRTNLVAVPNWLTELRRLTAVGTP